MQDKHKGAIAEIVASSWLLEQGYEVFKNVSQHGPVDLITLDPNSGDIKLYDVKTRSAPIFINKNGDKIEYTRKYKLLPEQERLKVNILTVDPETKSCEAI